MQQIAFAFDDLLLAKETMAGQDLQSLVTALSYLPVSSRPCFLEAFYSPHLAKRLLERAGDITNEQTLLERLQVMITTSSLLLTMIAGARVENAQAARHAE